MVAITEVTTKENVTGEDLDAHIARLSGRLEGDMTRAVTASGPPPEDENTGPETNEQSPWDIDNSIAPPEEEQVAKFKAEGNEHFKAGRLPEALECYSEAIEIAAARKHRNTADADPGSPTSPPLLSDGDSADGVVPGH